MCTAELEKLWEQKELKGHKYSLDYLDDNDHFVSMIPYQKCFVGMLYFEQIRSKKAI